MSFALKNQVNSGMLIGFNEQHIFHHLTAPDLQQNELFANQVITDVKESLHPFHPSKQESPQKSPIGMQ